VTDDLAADGVEPADRSVLFEADMRFSKQVHELQLPIDPTAATSAAGAAAMHDQLLADFNTEYVKRYGKGSVVLGAPVELASLRAIGVGRTVQAKLGSGAPEGAERTRQAVSSDARRVRIARGPDGLWEVSVFRGEDLAPGHTVRGPALVDGSDTTVWLPKDTEALVDRHGTLSITAIEVAQ
jgi:N-methylhydantoinase A